MAEEIDFENGRRFYFSVSRDLDLDLGMIGSYGVRSCITHRPLPTYQISFNMVSWTDGRADEGVDLKRLKG